VVSLIVICPCVAVHAHSIVLSPVSALYSFNTSYLKQSFIQNRRPIEINICNNSLQQVYWYGISSVDKEM